MRNALRVVPITVAPARTARLAWSALHAVEYTSGTATRSVQTRDVETGTTLVAGTATISAYAPFRVRPMPPMNATTGVPGASPPVRSTCTVPAHSIPRIVG